MLLTDIPQILQKQVDMWFFPSSFWLSVSYVINDTNNI